MVPAGGRIATHRLRAAAYRPAVGDGAMGDIITLTNVTASYQRHPAIHHISGRIAAGSLTAIMGPNGSGKSTLLKAIKGLIPLEHGKIIYTGIDRADIAFLPQYHQLEFHFPVSVLELVLLGHWRRAKLCGAMSLECQQAACDALARVGLAGFEQRRINTLSVGQLQRVLFARVIVEDARAILLDEPFNAVDSATTEILLQQIHRWHAEGRTLLLAVHDLAQANAHFPQAILMAREVVGWGDTASVLTQANLARTRAMVEAWDEHAPACALI